MAETGWKYKFVQVRLSDGKAVDTDYRGGNLMPLQHDPEATDILRRILYRLNSIDGALGDLLESTGKNRTPIGEGELPC